MFLFCWRVSHDVIQFHSANRWYHFFKKKIIKTWKIFDKAIRDPYQRNFPTPLDKSTKLLNLTNFIFISDKKEKKKEKKFDVFVIFHHNLILLLLLLWRNLYKYNFTFVLFPKYTILTVTKSSLVISIQTKKQTM